MILFGSVVCFPSAAEKDGFVLCGIPLWLTGTALGIMLMCVCARRIKSVELFEKKEAQYTTRIEGLMRERECEEEEELKLYRH